MIVDIASFQYYISTCLMRVVDWGSERLWLKGTKIKM